MKLTKTEVSAIAETIVDQVNSRRSKELKENNKNIFETCEKDKKFKTWVEVTGYSELSKIQSDYRIKLMFEKYFSVQIDNAYNSVYVKNVERKIVLENIGSEKEIDDLIESITNSYFS